MVNARVKIDGVLCSNLDTSIIDQETWADNWLEVNCNLQGSTIRIESDISYYVVFCGIRVLIDEVGGVNPTSVLELDI